MSKASFWGQNCRYAHGRQGRTYRRQGEDAFGKVVIGGGGGREGGRVMKEGHAHAFFPKVQKEKQRQCKRTVGAGAQYVRSSPRANNVGKPVSPWQGRWRLLGGSGRWW